MGVKCEFEIGAVQNCYGDEGVELEGKEFYLPVSCSNIIYGIELWVVVEWMDETIWFYRFQQVVVLPSSLQRSLYVLYMLRYVYMFSKNPTVQYLLFTKQPT